MRTHKGEESMREIKFRAWQKHHKRMLEVVNIDFRNNLLTADYGEGVAPRLNTFDIEDFKVMQHTGLKDKNGKEIYEGDIVDSWSGLDTHKMYIREVVKKEEEPRLDFNPSTGFTLCKGNEHLFEVIGSIYENPELLEETK
jgi:uncharacterized phage protein (TIGR01671 family)